MKILRIVAAICATLLVAQVASAQNSYTVQPGDTLSIEVLQDPALNRQTLVLPDGRFSFPYAGTIPAAGRTIGQLQEAVSGAIASNFNTPPDVFVSVTPAPQQPTAPTAVEPVTVAIYFVGEVASPGPKEFEPGVTLLQALSASGGFTNFAALKRLQLRRTDPSTGLQSVYKINYKALADGAQIRNNFPLQDGDVILVPERRLFE